MSEILMNAVENVRRSDRMLRECKVDDLADAMRLMALTGPGGRGR